MKYLLLVCADESLEVAPEEVGDIEVWLAETGARRLEGDRLRPVSDATTVSQGGRLVTDGPFAETKDQIAGYDIIDCSGLDEAIEIASKHPVAAFGAIEVRPFWS
jgi:hypothetical protein